MSTLYDQHGNAVAYVEPDGVIYLYEGTPVGYIEAEDVFAFDGRHLGWYLQGWVRDHHGGCVFFTEAAQGGPVRPVRAVRPVRGVRGVRPVRGVRQVRPVRPVMGIGWSRVSGPQFFR